MADFLLMLGKVNLAMGAAIVVVYLLRYPVRSLFHAPTCYALWLLVPITGLASLMPPRVATTLPAPMALTITAPTPLATTISHSPEMAQILVSRLGAVAIPSTLLFFAWALGAALMALYLMRLQRRFHTAAQIGKAGPAVVGFFRPLIVIPDNFGEKFTPHEQTAILAHEGIHLARHDARINGVVALVRCLCWFNPLVQMGVRWLRTDQELACDSVALAGQISRRDYANALLKSQLLGSLLPVGCNWRGSEHPLTERIVLLNRKSPTPARRISGMVLVIIAASFAGLSAWAEQPPALPNALDVTYRDIIAPDFPRPNSQLLKNQWEVYSIKSDPKGSPLTVTLQSERKQKLASGNWVGTGNVLMSFPIGLATADTVTTEPGPGHKYTLTGNVELNYGLGVLHGKELTFDPHTGLLDLDGKKMASGMPRLHQVAIGR